MVIMYIENKDIEITTNAVINDLKKITNQVYKLLPNREEGLDWELPLSTILEELYGMSRILIDYHDQLFPIVCKLEGLYLLILDEEFNLYRRTIFECLNLIAKLREEVSLCQD